MLHVEEMLSNSGRYEPDQHHSHLGVPTHNTFLYPRAASVSSRKCELRSVNRYWALLLLLSRGRSSTLGLLSSAVVTGRVLWEAWTSCSAGSSKTWQSWQNFLSSSGREANFLNLWDKKITVKIFLILKGRSQPCIKEERVPLISPAAVLLLGERRSTRSVFCFSGQESCLGHLQSKKIYCV